MAIKLISAKVTGGLESAPTGHAFHAIFIGETSTAKETAKAMAREAGWIDNRFSEVWLEIAP